MEHDEYVRRSEHRETCVATVKLNASYYQTTIAALNSENRLPTSDPWDPDLSKRVFERMVKQWRDGQNSLTEPASSPEDDDPDDSEPFYVREPCHSCALPVFEDPEAPMFVRVPPSTQELPWAMNNASTVPLKVPWRGAPTGGARAAVPAVGVGGDPVAAENKSADRPSRSTGGSANCQGRRSSSSGDFRKRSQSPVDMPDAPGANEDCSEETWQSRQAHRTEGVLAVKRSPDYIAVTTDSLYEHAKKPRSPDPTDRRLSKRTWERSMQLWRFQLADLRTMEKAFRAFVLNWVQIKRFQFQ